MKTPAILEAAAAADLALTACDETAISGN